MSLDCKLTEAFEKSHGNYGKDDEDDEEYDAGQEQVGGFHIVYESNPINARHCVSAWRGCCRSAVGTLQ